MTLALQNAVFSQTPENQVEHLRKALWALVADRACETVWKTAWVYDFEEGILQISFSLKAQKMDLESLDTLTLWNKALGTEKKENEEEIKDLLEKLVLETTAPYHLYVSPINELDENTKTLHFYWKAPLQNGEEKMQAILREEAENEVR